MLAMVEKGKVSSSRNFVRPNQSPNSSDLSQIPRSCKIINATAVCLHCTVCVHSLSRLYLYQITLPGDQGNGQQEVRMRFLHSGDLPGSRTDNDTNNVRQNFLPQITCSVTVVAGSRQGNTPEQTRVEQSATTQLWLSAEELVLTVNQLRHHDKTVLCCQPLHATEIPFRFFGQTNVNN